MPELKIPLLKGDRVSKDVEYRSALSQNALVVTHPVLGVSGFMSTHPGFTQFSSGLGEDRGGVYNERLGLHLRVSEDSLIQVNEDGTIVDLGPIAGLGTGLEHAALPYSFNTQAIIAGGNYYLYDPINDLRQITGEEVGVPIDACWIDGYYFFTDGEYLYHTELADEEVIEPIKFATSEFSPDPTVGVAKTQDNQVIVFNRYTTEFFRDAATEGFVFERIAGKATKVGIIGTFCKIEMKGLYYCLGSAKNEEPTFLIIGAGKSDNFSNREVDNILSTYTEEDLALTVMSTRSFEAEQLVYVELVRHTLVYSAMAAASAGPQHGWSILTTGESAGHDIATPWRFINPIWDPRVGAWLGGSRDSAQAELYAITDESALQDDELSETILYTPFINLEKTSMNSLQVYTIPGQSIGAMRIFLSCSVDGVSWGREWSAEYSAGEGDYLKRVEFRRLGYIRDWVNFRLRIVSANKVAFCDMVLDYG
jgi:hypothetical protein